ncbi:response regulator [Paenibacillus thalictri]|uniref:response regulator n=1 Tax=Paenibacillus thalictri TaxID=2527873 RepID=UPI0013EF17A9|nr:response regulator [Paenibacillus thalictri]
MWTVLLVEDEENVRRFVRRNIQWGAYGFEVAGEASNGKEAWELMERLRPDAVISDIMMPIMDGTELLEKARESGMESVFIMLTCLQELKYAQTAMQHGAFNYILKASMTLESLHGELIRLDRELSRRNERLAKDRRPWFDALYSGLWESDFSVNNSLEADVWLQETYPHLALFSVFHGNMPLEPYELQLKNLFRSSKPAIVNEFKKYGQTTIFVWSRSPIHPEPVLDDFPYPIVYGLAQALDQLPAVWQCILNEWDSAWYENQVMNKKTLLHGPDLGRERLSADGPLVWSIEKELVQAFEESKIEQVKQRLYDLMELMKQQKTRWYVVKKAALRWDEQIRRLVYGSRMDDGDSAIIHASSHRKLLHILQSRFEAYYYESIQANNQRTDHSEINVILSYLHQYYYQEISLKSMSQLVSMDGHYLSGLFKKKTGDSMITYLHKLRIE